MKDVVQELGALLLESEEFLESLSHRTHDAELLRADEALQSDGNGQIHIGFLHLLSQMEAGVSFREADKTLHVSDGNRQAARGQRLLTQFAIHFGNSVLVNAHQLGTHTLFGKDDVLFQKLQRNDLQIFFQAWILRQNS